MPSVRLFVRLFVRENQANNKKLQFQRGRQGPPILAPNPRQRHRNFPPISRDVPDKFAPAIRPLLRGAVRRDEPKRAFIHIRFASLIRGGR